MRYWLIVLALGFAMVSHAAEFKGKRDGATLYEMLGEKETATDTELFEAYRAAVKQFKPLEETANEDAYKVVLDAWAVLGRPVLRKVYDDYLSDARKRGLARDGEYDRGLFRAYLKLLIAQEGTADPKAFDHVSAFKVFQALYVAKEPPTAKGKGLGWSDALRRLAKCKSVFAQIVRYHVVAAAAAGAFFIVERAVAPTPALPPEIAPMTKPSDYVPPPPKHPDAPEDAGLKAAERMGIKFATKPPGGR